MESKSTLIFFQQILYQGEVDTTFPWQECSSFCHYDDDDDETFI